MKKFKMLKYLKINTLVNKKLLIIRWFKVNCAVLVLKVLNWIKLYRSVDPVVYSLRAIMNLLNFQTRGDKLSFKKWTKFKVIGSVTSWKLVSMKKGWENCSKSFWVEKVKFLTISQKHLELSQKYTVGSLQRKLDKYRSKKSQWNMEEDKTFLTHLRSAPLDLINFKRLEEDWSNKKSWCQPNQNQCF